MASCSSKGRAVSHSGRAVLAAEWRPVSWRLVEQNEAKVV